MLCQFNPRIVETLASEAALLRDENTGIEAWLDNQGIIERSEDGVGVKRAAFHELPLGLKRRVLRKAVEAAGGDARALSSLLVDEAVAFLDAAQTGRAMELRGGLAIIRQYETFLFREQA